MPQKPAFNPDNVNSKIAEIKSLPIAEREAIANLVKADLRGWLLDTFEFTPVESNCMQTWPESMREETGFGIGTALKNSEWALEINFPPDPTPTESKKHEQKVSGSYNVQTGTYTVTKSHSWFW